MRYKVKETLKSHHDDGSHCSFAERTGQEFDLATDTFGNKVADFDDGHRLNFVKHSIPSVAYSVKEPVSASHDYPVAELFGYRAWNIVGGKLKPLSYQSFTWEPGENIFRCNTKNYEGPVSLERCMQDKHNCGLYSYKEYDRMGSAWGGNTIRGKIRLSGVVLETKSGYRAERAAIVGIYNDSIISQIIARNYGAEVLDV